METKIIIVAYSDNTNNPKGIFTKKSYERFTNRDWVHHIKTIEVPLADWENDKVRIDTIRKYVNEYEFQCRRNSF
jgi:hypothetical protein